MRLTSYTIARFSIASFALILLCASNAFAFESVEFAIEEICGHMQGNLGGLLMTTAGIGGIVAAAFGNLRASHSLIVVGIGAAALSGFLSLYFPQAAELCHDAGQLQVGNGEVANGFNNNLNINPGAGAGQARINDLDTNNFGAAIDIAAGREANFGNNFTIQAQELEDDIGF